MQTRHPAVPTEELQNLVRIVRKLRKECPWDREQTHRSLRDSLIEETYEVAEALDRGNVEELQKELGDLLFHVLIHATIAEEAKEFTLREVVRSIRDKLIRRHPHVFGMKTVRDAQEVKQNWEKLKMTEGRRSILEGVPRAMPSIQRALLVQKRAATVGFDWKHEGDVWHKVLEEAEELRTSLATENQEKREEEFGDYLFALVNYARFIDVNPEIALGRAIEKFTRRFQSIEEELQKRGGDIHNSTLEAMDELWNKAKEQNL